MKKILLFLAITGFLGSCSGVKKTQEALNAGDYSNAINTSIQRLTENKTKKSNQEYILLLEEAYAKNTDRELRHIAFMEKDDNEATYEGIYKAYVNLKNLQERIKPLLPLRIIEENREAEFEFNDYDNHIIDYKEDLSEYLYDNAEHLLANATSKLDYQRAYEDFVYLNEINPGFEDAKEKMEKAYEKGIYYVKVGMVNNTQQIIPARLSEHLLNFNTLGLNEKWINYHTNHLSNVKYDFDMLISLEDILISPEQISERQFIKEKQVVDGYTYAEDANGNVVVDSLGNKIKIERFKTVTCRFEEFTQTKATQVAGQVIFTDLQSAQQVDSYPLSTEFVFEHRYGRSKGDNRALNDDEKRLLELQAVPFPTNEQMVYDAGEQLKATIKDIIARQRF
jgi:hypothetical protein